MARVINCPRDHSHAKLVREEGGMFSFYIDWCGNCGGVWLDHGEFGKLAGSRRAEREVVDYASGSSGLSCPVCTVIMEKRPFGACNVDVCPNCLGMWFDAGELDIALEKTTGRLWDSGRPKPETVQADVDVNRYRLVLALHPPDDFAGP